ncbi:MAG TPA: hypothetical protein VF586_19220 [Pyrinomonadaceae bacterium]
MQDRHSVTSCRVTDPAGNPSKSNTSFLGASPRCAFGAFAGSVAFAARAFAAAFGFGAAFFAVFDFDGAAFLAFGAAFLAAVFALLLVAAITGD